mmetsp:Transcript_7710/g.13175  ORF Transcript_7710/g.13175 Transcript_7710/m.13175 type:complete len:406 (-) Transcript_7710:1307-2524(-)|eukprot:CAMPEP_0196652200 /NCGR_PEP_ID=MMETSP1086-20130531/1424_1 /TAXON_ID=77921 /ORGANISM="Cyanoptyche  gloeocystis , Strain SAG4.97" /LENGTH=405 /DNA_ID=CAMNT_0041982613 /DNA_START=77 /DNA_END=1294 /DNA_ORIENTATION=+
MAGTGKMLLALVISSLSMFITVHGHVLQIPQPACGDVWVAGGNYTVSWGNTSEPSLNLILRRGPAPDRSSLIVPNTFGFDVYIAQNISNDRYDNSTWSTVVAVPRNQPPGVYHVAAVFLSNGLPGHLRTSRDFVVVSSSMKQNITLMEPSQSMYAFGAPIPVEWSLPASLSNTSNIDIYFKGSRISATPSDGMAILPGSISAAAALWKNNNIYGSVELRSNYFVYLESTYDTSVFGISQCFEMEPSYLDVATAPVCVSGTPCSVSWTVPQQAFITGAYSLSFVNAETTEAWASISSSQTSTSMPVPSNLPAGTYHIKVTATLSTPLTVQGSSRTNVYGFSPALAIVDGSSLNIDAVDQTARVLSAVAIGVAALALIVWIVLSLILLVKRRPAQVEGKHFEKAISI